MIDKTKKTFYQPDHLWPVSKATKSSIKLCLYQNKKDVRSWLTKQSVWEVYTPPRKETNHLHATKPNKEHQFHLLFVHHNVFKVKTYKYILTGVDVALRYKDARTFKTKEASEVASALKGMYKKAGVFKYPQIFQCDNGFELKLFNISNKITSFRTELCHESD